MRLVGMLGEPGLGEGLGATVDLVDGLAYQGVLELVLVDVRGSGLVLVKLGL